MEMPFCFCTDLSMAWSVCSEELVVQILQENLEGGNLPLKINCRELLVWGGGLNKDRSQVTVCSCAKGEKSTLLFIVALGCCCAVLAFWVVADGHVTT